MPSQWIHISTYYAVLHLVQFSYIVPSTHWGYCTYLFWCFSDGLKMGMSHQAFFWPCQLKQGTGKRGHCPMSTWKLPTPPPTNQSHFKLCDHFHLDNVFASPSKADIPWCLRNALWNIGIGISEERNKVPPSSTVSPCMLLYKQVMGNVQHRVNVLWAFSVAACERGNM